MGCPRLLCLATLLFMSGVTTGQTTHMSTTVPTTTTELTTPATTTTDPTTTTPTTTGQFMNMETTSVIPQGSAFFPMGSEATDLYISYEEYHTINLQHAFKYDGKTYNQLYLSENGFVVFSYPYFNTQVPDRYLGKDMIAPLWTDLDTGSGGRWTYEQATSGPLIDHANQEITRTFPHVKTSASWVFVATWENVPIKSYYYYHYQAVTVQVVLISDGGDHSFLLMNYGTIPYINSYYWLAGYCMEYSFFITIPVYYAYDLSSSSNVNIPGRWAFQLIDTSPTPPGSPLFPVGSEAIQLHLSHGSYQTIYLQKDFKYNGNTYTQIYLSVNGYLAFFNQYFITQVPNQYLGKDIIAPLWTYLNAGNGGRWTYEQATRGPLIDQANQEITRMFPYVNTSATWVFVATWENLPIDFYPFQGATFQVVLASDGGDHSFVLMNYGTIPFMYYNWLAGYGKENSYFVTLPVNNAYELSSSTNVNIPGRWAFQFTDTTTPSTALFPVGSEAIQFHPSIGSYQTIYLQQEFKYNGKTYTQAYLSVNGHIAFSDPNSFTQVPNQYLGKDIIAPLWTYLNAGNGGNLTYEQATSGPLIDLVNEELARMFPYENISASWVFLATWENVPIDFYPFQEVTFQLVLASIGGNSSIVLMNYRNIPDMYFYYWLSGYGMEYSHFVTIPIYNANELPVTTNVNITGRWAFQLTATSTTTTPTTLTPCQMLNCSWDEVCKELNGVYGCACGYMTVRSPNIYDTIESCSGGNGSLSMSRCQLFEAGYTTEVLHLNDPNCKGEVQNNRLVFSFDSGTCGTTLESNATHIILQNTVGATGSIGFISRSGGLNMTISCVYSLIQSISMPTDIQATGSVISKKLSSEGSYQISMIPFTDDTFTVPYSGTVTLEVNHQMYIGVQVDQFDSNQVALVLDNCWATPVNQMDYSVRWDLLVNECPNLNDGTVKLLKNGVSTSSHFSFRMFTFASYSSKIYLHCQVHLCLQKTEDCALSCPEHSRRRRSVDFYDSAAITMEI